MFDDTIDMNEKVLLHNSRFLKQKQYWLKQLSGPMGTTDIMGDHKEKSSADKLSGRERFDFSLPDQCCRQLLKITRQSDISIYIVLLAALKVLINRYTHNPDIVVISPLNRLKICEDTLNDMLLIRSRFKTDMSFKELILQVRQSVLDAYDNQDYPFEDLWELLFKQPLDRNSGFISGVVCSLKNLHDEDNIEMIKGRFDLAFCRENGQIDGSISYDTGIYSRTRVKQISHHYINLLNHALHDIDSPCNRISLLSTEEKKQLMIDFNGSRKDFPRLSTIHHFIESHARTAPQAVAVCCQGQTLTYWQLNRKANRLARLLRSCGVKNDHTVGIMLERSPLMAIGILAVWKAGGAYIPIDRQYPFSRTRRILEDSASQVLITQSSYVESPLQESYKGKIINPDSQEIQENREDAVNLELTVAMNSLAYVIYTSGSTGKPKGALIEHIGMMNHIHAKIDDLHITGQSAVAQNASHTFDISVWQFFAALVRAGTTVIYPDDVIMDPLRFMAQIIADRVTILEVVPSYLSVILESSHLNTGQPELLRYLLVTGEAVKPDLLNRWFARYPDIKVVNAYGPTEASDDITHHMMNRAPADNDVPIGSPVQNFNIYIVDEHMSLCPVGVKGEIWVSGIGVGRGYLNEIEKTRQVFSEDPFITEIQDIQGQVHRPGTGRTRLYKTGDLGLWLPDGTIRFLGRKDHQVKIRGFRIELGEIENRLVSHPGVNEAVIIDREDDRGNKYLCAYLVTNGSVEIAEIKTYLARFVPDYMVPSQWVKLEQMPLSATGKIDRSALPDVGVDTADKSEYIPPRTGMETLLADVMAAVLGIRPPGIHTNFFEMGGDSIKAIQISSRMYKAGCKVEMKDIFENPTIAELAARVTRLERTADQSVVMGDVPLIPIQLEFVEKMGTSPGSHHYNQAVMLHWQDGLDEGTARAIFKKIQEHHDALRMSYKRQGHRIIQTNRGLDHPFSLQVFDFRSTSTLAGQNADEALKFKVDEIQASLDLETGPLMKLGLFHLDDGDRLVIVVHHLVMDGISWRILFEDIRTLYRQYKNVEMFALPLKTDSFKVWSEKLQEYANTDAFLKEKAYWAELEAAAAQVPRIKKDFNEERNLIKDAGTQSLRLSEALTGQLLTGANESFGTDINDILLTALGLAVEKAFGHRKLLLALERHGREEIFKDVTINRTVGWFTSVFPVLLEFHPAHDLSRRIIDTKETLRRIPNNGIGYGILKYLTARQHKTGIDFSANPQVSFNYLGQFDADLEQGIFKMARESAGNSQSELLPREYELEVNGMIASAQLVLSLTYNQKQFKKETIENLLDCYRDELTAVISHCVSRTGIELTPADLTYKGLSVEKLEQLKKQYPLPLQDIYTLSPMQEGMLFHALFETGTSTYFEQLSYRLQGHLDIEMVEESLNRLMNRYDILRTVFIYEGLERPLQVILKQRRMDFSFRDIDEIIGRSAGKEEKEAVIKNFKENDRKSPFNLEKDVLVRVRIIKVGTGEYEFSWAFHHILMDGWCLGILIAEFFTIYTGLVQNRPYELPPVKPYRTYIQWLEKQDRQKPANYWAAYLEHYEETAGIPRTKQTWTADGTYKNQKVSFKLPAEKTGKLEQLAGKNQVTLNTVFQSIWGILLSKYCGKQDLVFGAVVSGRPAEIAGVESIVGLFINAIPVRLRILPGTAFSQLLKRVQADALNSEPFHHYPLSHIQTATALRHNLLDHLFIYENYPMAEQIDGALPGQKENAAPITLKVSDIDIFEQTNYDLNIIFSPGAQTIITLLFNGNVYDRQLMERLAKHFNRVIDQVLDDDARYIRDISLLTEEEKQQLLVEFNDTRAAYPRGETLHALFTRQAQRMPDRMALEESGEKHLTYNELDKRSGQLANWLKQKGVRPDSLVAVTAGRSLEMVINILGILKAGGAYLPVEPDYPTERLEYILNDSGTEFLLSRKDHPGFLASHLASIPPHRSSSLPSSLAYIIYTSGSTGQPKGVMVEHSAAVNLLWAMQNRCPLTASDSYLFKTSYMFDVSVTELFGWFLGGGRLAVLEQGGEKDPARIVAAVQTHQVTHINFVPSMFNVFLDTLTRGDREKLSSLKYILLAGEALLPGLVQKFREMETGIRLENLYGPTEATVYASGYSLQGWNGGPVPIGKPLANMSLYILDEYQQVQPIGVSGELYIGGHGLARGYLNNPLLTLERFISATKSQSHKGVCFSRCPGARMAKFYKTGDLARWDLEGNVEFLGRMDSQVKIRGYRIELGEIQNQLLKRDELTEAAVLLQKDKTGNRVICAYVVYKQGKQLSTSATALKHYLTRTLPAYMIPAHFLELEKMPLTASGKIDRKKLPLPGSKTSEDYVAPENQTEKIIADIWKDTLGLDKVSVNDNFFDLGGNSLLSIQIAGRFKEVFKRDIPIVIMYRYLTVRSLAAFLGNAHSRDNDLINERPEQLNQGKNRLKKTMKLMRK